ncbi:hypothetical protein PAXRUDRAFT_163928, partial [Paxillus rubicundulus Ve08.2h10]
PHNINISDSKLAPLDWEVLQDMEVILEVPSWAQQSMCGQSLPLLGGAIPSYETFLAQWTSLSMSRTNPQLVPFVSHGLEWANHYYNCIGRSKAYLFAMFVDPCIRISWVEWHWKTDAIVAAKADIRQKVSG